MTREEAIQILADLIDSPFLHTWEKQNKALHMAIEALHREEAEEKGYCHRIRPKEERKEPKGFTADEWYRDNFGDSNGK